MVAEVGQQGNGDRDDSHHWLEQERTIEKEGAWRLRELEHPTW